jgi:cell division protein FtsB
MMDDLEALKARRAELERQIAELESLQTALYMPGITIVPQEGIPAADTNQQLEQLRAAIIEIDTQIGAMTSHGNT